jgi:hypothetical protein
MFPVNGPIGGLAMILAQVAAFFSALPPPTSCWPAFVFATLVEIQPTQNLHQRHLAIGTVEIVRGRPIGRKT